MATQIKCGHPNSSKNRAKSRPCPTCFPTKPLAAPKLLIAPKPPIAHPHSAPAPKTAAVAPTRFAVRLESKKEGPDVWSTEGSLSITSTFLLTPMIGEATADHKYYSEPCGLGWRLSFKHLPHNTPLTTLRIAFEPYRYSSSLSHTISGHVTVDQREVSMDSVSIVPSTWESYTLLAPRRVLETNSAPMAPIKVVISVALPHVPSPLIANTPSVPAPVAVAPPVALVHQHSITSAALESISSGRIVDIKFVLFSKARGCQRQLSQPRELFGCTKIMKSRSAYLDAVILEAQKNESAQVPTDPPVDEEVDSDFGEESDDEDNGPKFRPFVPGFLESSSSVITDTLPQDSPARAQETRPISPFLVSISSGMSSAQEGEEGITALPTTPDVAVEPAFEFKGHGVVITEYAWKTWKCLLQYLYTGEITFTPLRSRGVATAITSDTCSPKSMYRLADELALPELKERALNAIKSGITTQNVAVELFSKFSQSNVEIRDFELEFLLRHEFDEIVGLDAILDNGLQGRLSAGSNHTIVEMMKRWSAQARQ